MTTEEVVEVLLNSNVLMHQGGESTEVCIGPSGRIPYYRELKTDKQGIVGKIIIFAKRVIRKAIRFVVEPICEEQGRMNQHYLRELEAMRSELSICKKRIEELEQD